MAGNAPQTPTSSNVGRAGTQSQPQISAGDLVGMVEQLQEHIQRLEGRLAVKSVKIRPPEPFNGTRSKLRAFLTQLDMYIQMNREKLVNEADKVLFATTYLTGPAFDWFEPFVRDYQEHTEDLQDEETKVMFASYAEFKKRLEGTFGDIDKSRNAERQLWRLKQTGSVSKLASEFQQIISHLDWDEDAYIAKFEEMLKPEIQEKLIWMERPDTLNKMIEQAVKIDNKLYDFNMRKKERSWGGFNNKRTTNYRANDRRPAQPRNQGYADPYGPQPMELDATQQSALSNEERERRRKERLCFRCGKPGHMSKDCKQQSRKGKHEKQLRATKELSATMDRGAYDTTGTVKLREKTNVLSAKRREQLRRLYQDWTNLSDEEIEQEIKAEYFTDCEEADGTTTNSKELAATSPEQNHENAVWTDGSSQARAWEKPSPMEPAQVDYPAIDYTAIDPLDEEYGTQWEGPGPGREAPHEAPEIPRDDSPRDDIEADQRVAQILAELQQQPEADRLNQAILEKIKKDTRGCMHWNLEWATGNYMHPRFKDQLKILGIKKAQPEPILGLNGENLGTHLLTDESGPVTMIVMGHIEQINFDIVPLGRGKPRTPKQQKTVIATTVLAAVAPMQRQLLVDQMGWAPMDDDEYVTTMFPEEVPESSTDEGHRSEGSRELAATSTDQISLPEEHEQYRELFKQSAQCTLPAHGKHDHHIPIQEGKTIACKKLYQMSEKESAALKAYIDEQLSLGKIRPSRSSFPLGPNKEVFDAEAEAALAGLKAAMSLETARFATNLWVFLDNLEVAVRLLSPSTGSSQRVFKTFYSMGPWT
ncbi:hypothetical protein CNMCM5793_007503 [Aspergillus hiratsukae]|uniref:CCHC-type domain-containing protein n=1 Tax=Aspergillus hiratsukae TaxID=1194566 RepID=A0A8H6PHR9_9EURO|nr:hypothetical protein CNMCM5793_007503 [Aspergillus hiratsukae]